MKAIILTVAGSLILGILIVPRIVSTDVLRLVPFLSIPSGELKSKHSDAALHTAENTKRKANDTSISFDEYIAGVVTMLNRVKYVNIDETIEDHQTRIEWATPYELKPNDSCKQNGKFTNAALLIHGLTDTPYLMKDIGEHLKKNHCFLVRSILLPGHGTVPGDLLNVDATDWIQASAYGVNSFFNEKNDIENLYIVGFSTGGALALYQALYSQQRLDEKKGQLLTAEALEKLKGLILLSPAVQVKDEKIAKFANLYKFVFTSDPGGHEHGKWIDIAADKDLAKYESFPMNAGYQIHRLADMVFCAENAFIWEIPEAKNWPVLNKLLCDTEHRHKTTKPILMAISKQDTTVNADAAIEFFNDVIENPNRLVKDHSKLIIYSTSLGKEIKETTDSIIWVNIDKGDKKNDENRNGKNPIILDLSHTAIPVAPDNEHYGNTTQENKSIYNNCVHYFSGSKKHDNPDKYRECMGYSKGKKIVYGEKIPEDFHENFIKLSKLEQEKCEFIESIDSINCKKEKSTLRRLTFNPYFEELTKEISNFITNTSSEMRNVEQN